MPGEKHFKVSNWWLCESMVFWILEPFSLIYSFIALYLFVCLYKKCQKVSQWFVLTIRLVFTLYLLISFTTMHIVVVLLLFFFVALKAHWTKYIILSWIFVNSTKPVAA